MKKGASLKIDPDGTAGAISSRALVPAMLIFLAICGTGGCGYHFRAIGEPMGIKIQSLAIPLIPSPSSDIGFEADFTRMIREEFISYAKVPIVSEESAQMVLKGRITRIETEPLTYRVRRQKVGGYFTTYEVTDSRRLRVRVEFSLTERETGRILWNDSAMEEQAGFDVTSDPLVDRKNRQEAVQTIARRISKRVFVKTMERF
jgi:hypothetical protein